MTGTAHSSTKTYLAVWGWLAVLMLLGVFLAERSALTPAIVCVVLLLSSVKAMLVVLYYMHLKEDRRLLGLIAIAPLIIIALALSVVFSSRFVRL